MHLRRALLLFAIVLGLAAIAASISQPGSDDDEPPPPRTEQATTPSVTEGDAIPDGAASPDTTDVVFDAGEARRRGVEAAQPATVIVEVEAPGMVEIPSLGLAAAAEPLTPARFDVLEAESGRHEIRFTPSDSDESRAAGTLVVRTGEA